MTKQKAIEILEEVKELDDSIYSYNLGYMRALEFAIEVLKEIPEKKVPSGSDIFNDYVRGWNDCIDEVTGETECITQKKDT